MKKSFIGIAALLLLAFMPLVLADVGDTGCGMGGMMYGIGGGYGSGMMLFSWVTWLLVVALIIAAIYWLVKNANRKR